jgi:hypothetical protein
MVEQTELSSEDFDRAYERMSVIFADVRGQVQFAEAKNGALFASTMALIIGIATVLSSLGEVPTSILLWLGTTGFGLAGAALLALFSFLPVMGAKRHRYARGGDGDAENVIFWGEIRRFTPLAYAEAFLLALKINGRPTRLIIDLAEQIVINSGIAHRKFRLFEAGAWATLTGMLAPSAILMVHLVLNGWVIN